MDHFPYQDLYNLSRELSSHKVDIGKIMHTAIAQSGRMVGVNEGIIVTFEDDESIEHAYVLHGDGSVDDSTQLWETLLTFGIIGFVYYAHRTVVIQNLATDPRWVGLPRRANMPQEGSAVGVPLYRDTVVFGVMMFIHPQVGYFDEPKIKLLEEIASLTANALSVASDRTGPESGRIRYQVVFDDAVVPMLLTDLDGTIIRMNHQAEALTENSASVLEGKPITEIHDVDLSSLGESGLQNLDINEEITFRTTIKSGMEDEIPVIIRARRLRFGNRHLIEWVEQNITAQMELEQLRRDLSAMVFHDVRGPLQAITGSIYKLAQVLAGHENPAVLTLLQIGLQSTRQLRRMIDSLLDIQRLEEGNTILNRDPIEMRVVLADATQLVQPLATDANQRIELKIEPDLPLVDLDNDMIVRVIINLMENAIKYTPEGGVITLGAVKRTEDIVVSVRDSGPGIPKEMQNQIFDKFSRVKYKDVPKGVGLGLAFCRLAVNAHGGHIWVESEEGNGSAFLFSIPLNAPDSASDDDILLATTA